MAHRISTHLSLLIKSLFLGLLLLSNAASQAQSPAPQFPAGPFPWNNEACGVSLNNLSIYTPDKEYSLNGQWYYNDSEPGWVTIEKAFASSEGGVYDSWVLATFTESGVEFYIDGTSGESGKKYIYSGENLANLSLQGYYVWDMGPHGYYEWIQNPSPFPVPETLNLGESMEGQDYIQSYLPNASFLAPAQTTSSPNETVKEPNKGSTTQQALDLTIDLKFQEGAWAPSN